MICAVVKTETKPVWNSSSFLIYTGGLTVLEGAFAALLYLATNFFGAGEMTAWALLIFVVLAAVARLLRRADRWLPAGIFAFNSVIAWAILVVLMLHWWGWENGSFGNVRVWSWPRLLVEVLVLLAATAARWRYKFPFIRLISAPVGAFFVIDLVTKGEGNSVAVVALLLGLVYLFVGHVSDKPSTFWLHLSAGLLIGGAIVYWCHTSTFDFAVIAFMSLVYVIWAYGTKRSSWAVYGTIGFFLAAYHFVASAVRSSIESGAFSGESPVERLWYVPLAIGLLGFWLVLLGMAGKRKKGDRHAPVKTEIKPIWSSSSFLVYTGGMTVLVGAISGLAYLASRYHGYGARTAWTLLFLVIIYGLAHALRIRGRWLAAGIFAFVSVLVWAALVLLTILWIGWHPFRFNLFTYGSTLSGWSWSRMLFWVLVLAAAWDDRRRFSFPFIRLISAVVFWLFLADLLTSFDGSWFAVVTLLTGLVYLLLGNVIDKPSAFWLHLIGGALIGGALLHWFHTSDGDFAAISIFAVLFVLVAYWTKRSSWAVYGTIGFFVATTHYVGASGLRSPVSLFFGASQECSGVAGSLTTCTPIGFTPIGSSPWSPALAYGLLGFWLVGLGMLGTWEKRRTHTAVVVETPAPPPPPAPPAAQEPPAE